MTEIWKEIEGYEGLYEVSNLGRVRSLGRRIETITRYGKKGSALIKNKVLKPREHTRGYLQFTLRKDNKGSNSYGHRLVADAFIQNPEDKPCVNHKNSNKKDNCTKNLEWVTYKENTNHGIVSGTINREEGIGTFIKKQS